MYTVNHAQIDLWFAQHANLNYPIRTESRTEHPIILGSYQHNSKTPNIFAQNDKVL